MADPVVLFDIDGTLTDTNYLHVTAWQRGFRDHGHDVAAWRIHRMIGASASRLMTELIGSPDDAVKEGWRIHLEELAPEIRAFPCARDLIQTVRRRGALAVLATSTPSDVVAHHLRALQLSEDDVDGLTTDSDVEDAKPEPDVFLAALRSVDGERSRAVALGDTAWDLEAATAAGLETIAVRSGGWTKDDLVQRGAIEVHDDVADLLSRLDSSALGDLLPT